MPAGDQKLAAELLNIADRAALVVAHPPPVREAFASTSGGVNVRLGSIDRFETYRLGPPLIDRFSTYRLTPIDRLKSID